MPVRIRLARHGRKSRPYYYIVVADSRAPRDGKFIERIGSYNPVTNPATVELDFDKTLDWMQKGAQPSDTVRNLLQQKGVMYKNHLLKGVKKGALTEEQAEQQFQVWLSEKENQLHGIVQKIKSEQDSDEKARFDAEIKIRESMAAELAKKRSDLVAAEAEVEETATEVVEEVVEFKEEAPAAVEETAVEVAEEAPAAVEETAIEVAEEAPAAVEETAIEVAEEAPAAVEETAVEAAEVKVEEPAKEEARDKEKSGEEKSEG